MESTAAVLTARNLGKKYGAFQALDALDLAIQPGEVVGLLGPNGSGKTTALRLILGFLKPTTGWSRLGLFDSWTQGDQARALVSYLPAELRLYDNMTGRRLVDWLGSFRAEKPDPVRIDRLAQLFELDLARPLGKLSSGMKRKVALLSALATQSSLLILDEPTNALDPAMRQALIEQTREASQRGQAVLFSSHVLEEVEAVADRVIVLRKGKLVLEKSLADLKKGVCIRMKLDRPLIIPESLQLSVRLIANDRGSIELYAPAWSSELMAWLGGLGAREMNLLSTGLRQVLEESAK